MILEHFNLVLHLDIYNAAKNENNEIVLLKEQA